MSKKKYYPDYKICVSGAADTRNCGESAFGIAEELGREVIRHNAALLQGATTGFPYWAAKGAKSEGGMVIGFSPAGSRHEHEEKYRLPTDYQDLIVYTASNFSGRDLMMVRSSDAVVVGCGRMGTINEFTIAFEDKKPIGILRGEWKTDELFDRILEESGRAKEREGLIVSDSDPKTLLDKLAKILNRINKDISHAQDIL